MEVFHRMSNGFLQALIVDGLQNVVNGVHIEGVHGVLVKCGDKDHQWHGVALKFTYYLKTVHARHLYVQEQQVWLQLCHRPQCLFAIATFSDQLEFGMIFQPQLETAPGERFVVNNNCTQFAHGAPVVGFRG